VLNTRGMEITAREVEHAFRLDSGAEERFPVQRDCLGRVAPGHPWREAGCIEQSARTERRGPTLSLEREPSTNDGWRDAGRK
jgi:hypothetical protein